MAFHGAGWRRSLLASEERPQLSWGLLKRALAYALPHRRRIAALLCIIMLMTGVNLIQPLILRDLIDRTIPAGDFSRLVSMSLLLLVIPMVGGVLAVLQRRVNASVGEGVIFDLRVALFAHLQRMSLRFFTHTKVGELMSRLNMDVVGAHNAISNTIVDITSNLIQAVAVLSVMVALDWRLSLLSVAVFPLYFAVTRPLSKRLRSISRSQMEANAQMNAMVNETLAIGGALLVKLFGRSHIEVERFRDRAGKVRDKGVQRAVMGSAAIMIIGLVSAVGTALIYGFGGYLTMAGKLTIGSIVAFAAYLASFYSALRSLANAPVEFATSMVSFERVFEVIDLPVEIQDSEVSEVSEDVKGEITFEDVWFTYSTDDRFLLRDVRRYGMTAEVSAVFSVGGRKGSGPEQPSAKGVPGAGRMSGGPGESVAASGEVPHHSQARDYALSGVSFTAHPGRLIALVGPSGAGKSTLTYLIPRLYDVTRGRVLMDGRDLRSLPIEWLSARIGMVTQETHLFHDTIRTNLLYAKLDATFEELVGATRAASIHDFIAGLPEGYDTIVGERGYRLSGGEKQRIALARVILKDPKILVLDEATSHLDSESEVLIQESLRHIMAGRTSIVIAHRLSTILAADLILVMDRGEIVERGSHQELLEKDGVYAMLYRTQFKAEAGRHRSVPAE